MTEAYLPPSEFLQAVIREEIALSGCVGAESNFHQLMAMTKDAETANRDWATFLLAQEEVDTFEVRSVLIQAAQDADAVVRAEAILGLAQREKSVALPFLQKELAGDTVWLPIFEAAAIVAEASLADDLQHFASPSGHAAVDSAADEALRACDAARYRKHRES